MTTIQGRREPTIDLDVLGDGCDAEADPPTRPSAPLLPEQPVLEAQALIDRAGLGHLIELLRIKMGFPSEVFALAARPLISGYAEFVQLLPVAGSRRYGDPGGQLHRAVGMALRALDHRRGQILPRGAAPEVIGAHAHRWTYAVFAAALLCDAARASAGMRVWIAADGGALAPWDPATGSMFACGAVCYRIEILAPEVPTCVAGSTAALSVFERCVPPVIQSWLGEDAALMAELRSVLTGTAEPAGAIAELVERAATGMRRIAPPLSAPGSQSSLPPPAAEPSAESAPADLPTVEPEFLDDVDARGLPLARRFMQWLRQGILTATLPVNAPGALVHVVADGLLLASPRIFREFVRQCAANLAEGAGAERSGDAAKQVQREVLRAGWHLQANRGVNILAYELRRGDRGNGRIHGIVIRAPERFVDPLPAVNPLLVRVPDSADSAD